MIVGCGNENVFRRNSGDLRQLFHQAGSSRIVCQFVGEHQQLLAAIVNDNGAAVHIVINFALQQRRHAPIGKAAGNGIHIGSRIDAGLRRADHQFTHIHTVPFIPHSDIHHCRSRQ